MLLCGNRFSVDKLAKMAGAFQGLIRTFKIYMIEAHCKFI